MSDFISNPREILVLAEDQGNIQLVLPKTRELAPIFSIFPNFSPDA